MAVLSQRYLYPAVAALVPVGIMAVAGRMATDLGPWYQGLVQPDWKPDDSYFGPGWAVIYLFIIAGFAKAWADAPASKPRNWLVQLMVVNVFLNVLWSVLFFYHQRPDIAFGEVILLWGSVAAFVFVVGQWSFAGAVLLLPYLAWVTFAAALNFEVMTLNWPFG